MKLAQKADGKVPVLQEGSEYARRWRNGARTIAELDPDMDEWIKCRMKWRGRRVMALMAIGGMYLALLVFALAGTINGPGLH